MELSLISVDQIENFMVIFSRVGGFLAAIPVLFSGQAPARIKVVLAFFISLIFFPILQPQIASFQFSTGAFLLLIINELLLGMLVGLIARLIFTSVEYGGTVIGYQMGFAAANVFDPQSQRQTSLVSQFQNVFAILLFLSLDIHHYFIKIAVHSYEILPPGNLDFSGEAVVFLMELSSRMFILGAQFSIPVLAILLLSSLILGVLARTFPQLNVFLLSFPLNIGISFVVISLTLGLLKIVISREFDNLPDRIMTILQLLH